MSTEHSPLLLEGRLRQDESELGKPGSPGQLLGEEGDEVLAMSLVRMEQMMARKMIWRLRLLNEESDRGESPNEGAVEVPLAPGLNVLRRRLKTVDYRKEQIHRLQIT